MKTNRLILLLFILFPAYVLAGNRFQELYISLSHSKKLKWE